MNIRIKKLNEVAIIPTRATRGSNGYDLYSVEDCEIRPGETRVVSNGIEIAVPYECVCLICPRSGMAAKHGVTVLNSPAIIDNDFRGCVKTVLINHGEEVYRIKKGDRIAQMLFLGSVYTEFVETDDLGVTDRKGGFGHTGR